MKKKEDYFGRILDNEDIVIIYYQKKLELGVIINNKIKTLTSIERSVSTKYCYYLENPTENELEIRDKILEKWKEVEKKKKLEKNIYGTMIGGIYSTHQGKYALYLGPLSMISYFKDGTIYTKNQGHCYFLYQDLEKLKKLTLTQMLEMKYCFSIQKGYKKVDGLCGVSDEFTDVKKNYGNYLFNYYNYKKHIQEIGRTEISEIKK